jgi:hypothetical protein
MRRRTVTPSPLSQSTSAIHQQTLDPGLTHKPSKRPRRLTGLFGSRTGSTDNGGLSSLGNSFSISRLSFQSHSEGSKRGSVLGRFVRKFSLSRKSDNQPQGVVDDWQHIGTSADSPSTGTGESAKGADHSQRSSLADADSLSGDRRSVISAGSLQIAATGAILTIANPDVHDSPVNTPMQQDVTLPAERDPSPSQNAPDAEPEPLNVQSNPTPPPQQPERPRQTQSVSQTTIALPVPPSPSAGTPKRQSPMLSSAEVPLVATPRNPTRRPSPVQHDLSTPSQQYRQPTPPATPRNPPRRPSPIEHDLSTSSQQYRHPTPPPSTPGPPPPPKLPASHAPTLPPLSATEPFFAQPHHLRMEDSPMSALSVLANPPTPYNEAVLRLVSPSPSPPEELPLPVPSSSRTPPEERHTRNPSPSKAGRGDEKQHANVTRRETETFRLVRNSSGQNVGQNGHSIVAAGEQWDVVPSSDNSSHRRSRAKEKEKEREKEREREKEKPRRSSREYDNGNRRDQRRQEWPRTDPEPVQRRDSGDYVQQSWTNATAHRQSEASSSAQARNSEHQGWTTGSAHRHSEASAYAQARNLDAQMRQEAKTYADLNKPQPPPPETPRAPPHRQLSTPGPRPTSELASSAELNAVRARDAWEINRLYRGRSMHYGAEPNGAMSSPAPVMASMPPHHRHSQSEHHRDPYGSSHTGYSVQSSFQGEYFAMPPPPILYSPSAASQASPPLSAYYSTHSFQQPGSPQYTQPYHGMPSSLSIPSIDTLSTEPAHHPHQRAPLANPLPEPPRESAYEPSMVPPPNKGPSTVSRWAKYIGVAAAH